VGSQKAPNAHPATHPALRDTVLSVTPVRSPLPTTTRSDPAGTLKGFRVWLPSPSESSKVEVIRGRNRALATDMCGCACRRLPRGRCRGGTGAGRPEHGHGVKREKRSGMGECMGSEGRWGRGTRGDGGHCHYPPQSPHSPAHREKPKPNKTRKNGPCPARRPSLPRSPRTPRQGHVARRATMCDRGRGSVPPGTPTLPLLATPQVLTD
jgi:hypothetical protein